MAIIRHTPTFGATRVTYLVAAFLFTLVLYWYIKERLRAGGDFEMLSGVDFETALPGGLNERLPRSEQEQSRERRTESPTPPPTISPAAPAAAAGGGAPSRDGVSSFPSPPSTVAERPPRDVPAGVTLGGTLVVNLDTDRVRWESTIKQLYASTMISQTDASITRVSGVLAADLDLHRLLLDNKLARAAYNDIVAQDRVIGGDSLTIGALGCLEAHVKVWRQIVSLGKPAIVFEDDVTLSADFDAGLAKALMHLPSDFGLLYLANVIGAPIEKCLKPFDDTLWRMEGGHYGAYAYVISPSAAAALLDAVYPAYAQVDTIIIDVAKSAHLRVFMSRTPLLSVDNSAGRDSRTQRWAPPPLRLPRVLHTVSLGGGCAQSESDSESVLAAWANLHPTWELKRWNESSLPSSVRLLLSTSKGSPELIDRLVRYELVWRFGGVYVNVDVEPLRSIEPLLLGLDAFVAYESESQLTERIFGAVPRHPLMGHLVSRMRMLEITATYVSGPTFLTAQVKESLSSAPIKAFREFEAHIFFPPSPASNAELLLAYAVRRQCGLAKQTDSPPST